MLDARHLSEKINWSKTLPWQGLQADGRHPPHPVHWREPRSSLPDGRGDLL